MMRWDDNDGMMIMMMVAVVAVAVLVVLVVVVVVMVMVVMPVVVVEMMVVEVLVLVVVLVVVVVMVAVVMVFVVVVVVVIVLLLVVMVVVVVGISVGGGGSDGGDGGSDGDGGVGEKDTMVHVKSSEISWIMPPGGGYVGMTVQEGEEGVVLFGSAFQPLVPIAEVIRKVLLCSLFTYLYWENQRTGFLSICTKPKSKALMQKPDLEDAEMLRSSLLILDNPLPASCHVLGTMMDSKKQDMQKSPFEALPCHVVE
ncbi:Wd Repeat-Containing Protein 87 [Manis pentadactyla]|nr:Wd Repeat-Containing Protein 87 [Manis pentadactyla]